MGESFVDVFLFLLSFPVRFRSTMNNFDPTKPPEANNVAPMFPYPPPTMDATAAFYQWYMQATMCAFQQPQQFFPMPAAPITNPLPIVENPPQRPPDERTTYPSNSDYPDRKRSFHSSSSSRDMHRSSSTNKYSYSSEPSFRCEQRNYRYPSSKRPRSQNQPIPDEYRE